MSSSGSPQAQERSLPQTPFYSIEYPGYVQPASTRVALQSLGGQTSINNAFKRSSTKAEALVELSLNSSNPFAHPIPGEVVPTNNVLIKIIRRKRKHQPSSLLDETTVGDYTAEAVGVIPKTVRFRSMADFHFQPDMADEISQLRVAMNKMNVDAIHNYTIPEETSVYLTSMNNPLAEADPASMDVESDGDSQPTPLAATTVVADRMKSNLRLFPPPLFSRQTIPQAYNFKANPASMVTTTTDEETGEEKKRLINRMRWKGYGPASIMFSDASVPTQPPSTAEENRHQINQTLLMQLQAFFVDRPIWARSSLLNQFTPAETREIINSKVLLPLVCYVFQDGPWRDTLVRFGYDPRTNPEARFYQRLYFRNANHPIARPSVTSRKQDRAAANIHTRSTDSSATSEGDRKVSHIFDGQTLAKETAAFQLCDIVDPMLKEMINDTEDLRETCNERDGWYSTQAFERIKTVLRYKFFSLLEGRIASDEECRTLLANEGPGKVFTMSRIQKLRAGKHNMAKGAQRPEEAAALRLQAALDRNTKGLQGHRQ